jgi:hypothetical protein
VLGRPPGAWFPVSSQPPSTEPSKERRCFEAASKAAAGFIKAWSPSPDCLAHAPRGQCCGPLHGRHPG